VNDWSIEVYKDQINSIGLACKFSHSFPQRSNQFFQKVIDSLDETNSRLFVLVIDGEIKGATFAFRVSGYNFDVWSPSYLYVEKEHRNVSLLFIVGVLRKMGSKIIDVSPTNDVKKILSAIKYKELSKGSLILPAFQGIFRSIFKQKFFSRSSPIERFKQRSDLMWVSLVDGESFYCLKKTSRYGIQVFLLVYFDKTRLMHDIQDLCCFVAKINPLGILVIPNIFGITRFLSLRSNKFHTFSNFIDLGEVYSILGSEVTEVI